MQWQRCESGQLWKYRLQELLKPADHPTLPRCLFLRRSIRLGQEPTSQQLEGRQMPRPSHDYCKRECDEAHGRLKCLLVQPAPCRLSSCNQHISDCRPDSWGHVSKIDALGMRPPCLSSLPHVASAPAISADQIAGIMYIYRLMSQYVQGCRLGDEASMLVEPAPCCLSTCSQEIQVSNENAFVGSFGTCPSTHAELHRWKIAQLWVCCTWPGLAWCSVLQIRSNMHH